MALLINDAVSGSMGASGEGGHWDIGLHPENLKSVGPHVGAGESVRYWHMARPSPIHNSHLTTARGLLQLGVGATVGVASLAEAVHLAVISATPFSPARGLTRAVYGGVRGLAGLTGQGGDRALRLAGRFLGADGVRDSHAVAFPPGVRSALNGIAGDRLGRMGNPLALPMSIERHRRLRQAGRRAGTGRVVFVHGLCMHDRHWQEGDADGVCFGERLRAAHGLDVSYLRYNSGVSIAENGRRLAALLEQRQSGRHAWREPLHFVAHSLGGLLVRSALAAGLVEGHVWPGRLGQIVFLGTPHEGAPLERIGSAVEAWLSVSRFSAPWSALGRLRSVAIRQLGKAELPPLGIALDSVGFHAVAGRTEAMVPGRVGDAWGDGLVPVSSALGARLSPASLRLDSRRVFNGVGHLGLIRHPDVAAHVARLLDPAKQGLT